MCRCKYPKSINRKNIKVIEDEQGYRCYKVSFKVSNNGKNILVIGREPRKIEEDNFNEIYKRIIKYLDLNKEEIGEIKEITIVNLFSLYDISRENIFNEFLLDSSYYMEYNNQIISQCIDEADLIIEAWGEPLEGIEKVYGDRVEFVLRIIRENIVNCKNRKEVMHVGELSRKGYPRHCLAWTYKEVLKKSW